MVMFDWSKNPMLVDIEDDSMIGTEARRQHDEAIDVIARNMADTIDAEIIEEIRNMKATIEDFKIWLVDLGVSPEFLEKVHTEDVLGGSRTLSVRLHMRDICYRVTVVYREKDDGWMGCSTTPGYPLTSGPFTYDTWQKMSIGMKGHTLIRVTQDSPIFRYG